MGINNVQMYDGHNDLDFENGEQAYEHADPQIYS